MSREVGSVAPERAAEKRSIQMKHFRSKEAIEKCIRDQVSVALGQVIGYAAACKQRENELPSGGKAVSYLTIGDFEAMNYATGETFTATGIYLPKYFAETVEASLAGNPTGIAFAIEILVEPTGRSVTEGGILYAYAVKRLLARRADSPLEAMKRELAAAGKLRLPAPAPVAPALSADPLAEEEVEPEGEPEGEPKTWPEADATVRASKPPKSRRAA